jgi:hypothetical protein
MQRVPAGNQRREEHADYSTEKKKLLFINRIISKNVRDSSGIGWELGRAVSKTDWYPYRLLKLGY